MAEADDAVAELVADALPAIAEAIDRERSDGRPPRTALALLRVIATARRELLLPTAPIPEPEPQTVGTPSWLDEHLADLDAMANRRGRVSRR